MENDPFFYVLTAYASLLQDPQRAQMLNDMDEEQRRQEFAQGFEMLQENAFLSFWNYLSEHHENNYAFYDTDGNGTMALLISGRGLIDIYVIQNGVAVQQRSFPPGAESGSDTWLQENGVITSLNDEEGSRRYYRFEDGILRFQGGLTQNIHTLADGSEISITLDEYVQLREKYRGGSAVRAQLDWRPLSEFGR